MNREDIAAIVRGLAPVVRDIMSAALREHAAAVASMGSRVATLETDRLAIADLPGLRDRLTRLEATTAAGADVPTLVNTLRERVAVIEARPAAPGPPGPVGLDDLELRLDDAQTLSLVALRGGEVVKTIPMPLPHDAGVYRPGTAYQPGALVTWEGSLWICREATSGKPLDGVKAWRLCVKRGKDGRDGKDARGADSPH